ncbi:MAG: F0F1 ATP synthase subunit A [Thermodesulfovibrionales bacterium]|nr:F0F1 ATP synthase subunit A [Thermodesulfovibrionales bacterium]
MESPSFLHMAFPSIPYYVSYSWLAMGILIGLAVYLRGKIAVLPSGLQNVMEVFADFFLNLSNNVIGHHWGEHFYPLIGTLGLYIGLCNFMGLIPGFESPTSNINMTASMAVPVFLATHYYGIKVHGPKYILHFLGPIRTLAALPLMIFMFFLELIGHLVRPVTLSVRLFGNMMAKHYLLVILAILTPWVIPTAILCLGTLISVIQAYVFMLLTCLYLAGAVEEAH